MLQCDCLFLQLQYPEEQPSKSSGRHFFGIETRMRTQCKFLLFEFYFSEVSFEIIPYPTYPRNSGVDKIYS
jgi:hypothetical protein